jgi:hypothetical protein
VGGGARRGSFCLAHRSEGILGNMKILQAYVGGHVARCMVWLGVNGRSGFSC